MILRRIRLVVPDGSGILAVPSTTTLQWPAGSDVTIPVEVVHADGSVYNLSGSVVGVLGFKKKENDSEPFLQREWSITNATAGEAEFTIARGDVLVLPTSYYVAGVQFRDDDADVEDSILLPSRVVISRTIGNLALL